jgi:hypothetical protein
MHARRSIAFALFSVGLVVAVQARAVTWTTTVSCPYGSGSPDDLSRGFYVTHYAGNNLSQVELKMLASGGTWKITLTAHRGGFDGPIIGSPQIATPTFTTGVEMLVVFDFGGAPVTTGDTIAFTAEAERVTIGLPGISFNTGNGTTCANVYETNGTSAPLDTVRRTSFGITITQQVVTTSCVPSDTVLCLDNVPGDHRFKVTVTYHTSQAGGLAGIGRATPLSDQGVFHGGAFWFFKQDNPELLIKVLNGCGVNSRFWVYLSAATNVSFTVTVNDTSTGQMFTHTNPDLTEAAPVQDVNALASCP